MSNEFINYIGAIDLLEDKIIDDSKFPVVNDSKVKKCCRYTLEMTKVIIYYIKFNIDATKKEN